MDLSSFSENFKVAKKYCVGFSDRIKYLLLLYSNSGKLHKVTGDKSYTIRFSFPAPIGPLKLQLRNNKGSDTFIFSELFLHNYYDLKRISKPATILDLGANIGLTAIFWSKSYPGSQLACVEPMPNNVEVLKWNVKENSIDAAVIDGAVATEDGEVFMEIAEKDYGHQVSSGPGSGRNTVKVNAYSIGSIMQQLGWSSIDLLKIDIEGYEKYLLTKNCDWLHKVNYMIIELHEEGMELELEKLADAYHFTRPVAIQGLWHLSKIR